MEPDPVPACALKLLVAMTEHNPTFARYREDSTAAAKAGVGGGWGGCHCPDPLLLAVVIDTVLARILMF